MRPTGRFFCAVHSPHSVFRVRRASCPSPAAYLPASCFILRSTKRRAHLRRVSLITVAPKALLPLPAARSPPRQSAPYPARRLCHTAFPGGPLSRRMLHIAPAKPCIPCRRLSSSGALRQSKPASRQRPIRPHHRKSTAFSRRAALSRDIAPFQAAVALHGQTRRIKSALHGQAHPFRPYFYQNLERVSARRAKRSPRHPAMNRPVRRALSRLWPHHCSSMRRISSFFCSAAMKSSMLICPALY